MNLTNRFLSVERQHFNRLSRQAQYLIGTFFMFNLIFPIFTTFTFAFIWRQTQDIITVSLFNLAFFMTLPLGFYINGHLLKKFLPAKLYFMGIFFQALFTAAVIFSPVNNLTVFIYGILIGISAGFLWSNRNLLVLRITANENRIYFTSLDSTISMLSNIVIPIIIGSFIVFGETAHLYTPVQGYYLLSLYILIMLIFIFHRIKHITTKLPQLTAITLKRPSKNWTKMRYFTFIFGMLGGLIGFLPVIMILLFIGKEDAVGTVQSLSAVLAAIVVYTMAKKINREQRLWIIAASVVLFILAALSFAFFYSKLGVYIFFIFQSLAVPLGIIGYSTLLYELIEQENETKNNHYAHIFDSELMINSGRIVAIFIFLLTIHFFSQGPAIRYILLLLTALQILLFIIAASIERGQKKIPVTTSQLTIDQV